jgi:hypothetical protein
MSTDPELTYMTPDHPMTDADHHRGRAVADSVIFETTALAIVWALEQRFGWATAIVTRADAEDRAQRRLTDAEWEAVRLTRDWEILFDDGPYEAACEGIWDALESAGVDVEC